MIIPLISSDRTLDPALNIRFLLFSCWLFIVSVWVIQSKRFKSLLQSGKELKQWLLVYLAYFLISGFSLFLVAGNLADGIFQWLLIFNLGVAVFLISILLRAVENPYAEIVKGMVILGLVSVLNGYFQFITLILPKGLTHQTAYLLTGTFANKNIFAEVLCLLLPFQVFAMIQLKKLWKFLSGFTLLSSIFLIILSLSRSAWLSISIVGLCISVILIILNYKQLRFIYKHGTAWITLFLILVFIISSLTIVIRLGSSGIISKQVHELSHPTYGSAKDRLVLWEKTLQIFKEKPYWGSGLGTWKIEMMKHGNKGLKSADNTTFYQRPHNDYLWVLSEQGIFAFVILILLYGLLLRSILISLIKRKEHFQQLKLLAILASLLLYMSLSFFAFPKERIEHTIILATLISLVFYKSTGQQSHDYEIKSPVVMTPILLILIFSIYAGYSRTLSEMRTRDALLARDQGRWEDALYRFHQADNWLYHMDPMSTPISWYEGLMYYNLGDKSNAFHCFSAAYDLCPNHPHVLNNLATCYVERGDAKRAIPLLQTAIKLSPSFSEAAVNLSAVEFNSGELDKAYHTIIKVDTIYKSELYTKALYLILRTRARHYFEKLQDPDFLVFANTILGKDEWVKNIFVKSLIHKCDFNFQLVTDIVWIADKDNKTILANRFKKHLSLRYD